MSLRRQLDAFLGRAGDELVGLRRDLHRHPELGRAEHRTTRVLVERLTAAGLAPRVLPGGTGVLADIGSAPAVGLRADIDALPVQDETPPAYRSTVPGVAHACGHDVHTAVVLGAGLFLTELHREGRLPGGVRLVFQPAEELMPGGALDVLAAGGADGLHALFAVHCDPRTPVGGTALRAGPVTSASDAVTVRLSGPGGHTARPHLTADLVTALGDVIVSVPALISRRFDPRAGMTLVWGEVLAGSAHNAIPSSGTVRGTLRMLRHDVWESAPHLVRELVESVARPYGVAVQVDYERGVPPVVNDEGCVEVLNGVVSDLFGPDAVHDTEQSLGGEDFAWYLEHVPGAIARLGVRGAGAAAAPDLHQASFDVDERCIGVGVGVLAGAALRALGVGADSPPGSAQRS